MKNATMSNANQISQEFDSDSKSQLSKRSSKKERLGR